MRQSGVSHLFRIQALFILLILVTTSLVFYRSGLCQDDPGTWTLDYQREDLAPDAWHDTETSRNGNPSLALSGAGKEHVNGHWARTQRVEPGKHYRFSAYYSTYRVKEIARTVVARVIWQDNSGKPIGRAEYPATRARESGNEWHEFGQTYRIPDEATQAKLELIYRWDADGEVYFSDVSFRQVDALQPRLVRLASVHHYPRNSPSPQHNLEKFAEFVHVAAAKQADIVCLPEGVTLAGTGKTYLDVSEPVPGPSTRFLGDVAKQNGIYIVAGIYEKTGDVVYNTSVLLDRQGELAGKYRKVCLPREEIVGGITPGSSFPTFETDFGRIGMMICWDVAFPEPARTLAMNGAEVILMPIWGGNLTLARARAIENQIYLVSSTYHMKTAVFDLEGNIMAEADEENPVVVVEVDLNEQKLWPWLGDLKNRIPHEMPPRAATEITSD